jgi:hypothetical protein
MSVITKTVLRAAALGQSTSASTNPDNATVPAVNQHRIVKSHSAISAVQRSIVHLQPRILCRHSVGGRKADPESRVRQTISSAREDEWALNIQGQYAIGEVGYVR